MLLSYCMQQDRELLELLGECLRTLHAHSKVQQPPGLQSSCTVPPGCMARLARLISGSMHGETNHQGSTGHAEQLAAPTPVMAAQQAMHNSVVQFTLPQSMAQPHGSPASDTAGGGLQHQHQH